MAIEVERLIATLEAKLDKFEKSLAKASGTADKQFKKVEDRGKKMEATLAGLGVASFKGFLSGATGALAAGLSLTAVINGAKAALKQYGDISDQSAAAGVDAEFFQGIAYQAKLAGVEVDGVAGALATFNKNSGQLEQGTGRLFALLKSMNPELVHQIQLATTQEQRFLLVADAISKSKTAAEQAALAAAAFGDQGAKLVGVLAKGADEIERLNRNAKEMGIIVDRDLIGRADELGDKLDTAATIVQTKLNSGLVDLAPLLTDAAGWAAELARLLAIAYEQTKAIEQRQFLNPLQNQLAETYNKMQPLKDEIADIEQTLAGDGPNGGWVLNVRADQARQELATLTAQANELLERIQELQGYKPPAVPGGPMPGYEAGMLGRGGPGRSDPRSGMKGRGGPGRVKLAEPFYGPGSPGYEAGLRAIKDGSDAAGTSLVNTTAALDTLGQKAVDVTKVGEDFVQSFFDGILNGKSAVDSLIGSLGDLAKQLASTFLNNGISQLFGSGFSAFGGSAITPRTGLLPSFAGGGSTGGGSRSGGLDGMGGFLAMMHPQESVIDHARGGAAKVTNNVFNYGSDRVETRPNQSGGVDVIISAVEQRIKGNMAQGKYRQFGVDPGTKRR